MEADAVDIFVLNHNGCALLAECLDSVVRAAESSRYACRVVVVDNTSSDDSRHWLAQHSPTVEVWSYPNDGLISLNAAVARSSAPVVVLLNNDIRMSEDALDPLVAPLFASLAAADEVEPVFATAPRCFLFDGVTHEGFQTAVTMRRGLVSATAHFPEAKALADFDGPTASVGAALAVRRDIFLQLRGFDPLYLPGRIEDLDFCFRGFLAGYQARYVAASAAYHRGAASFGPRFGSAGCDRLALRNTLLFQWKNIRSLRRRTSLACWTRIRIAADCFRAPWSTPERRFSFVVAWHEARERWSRRDVEADHKPTDAALRREHEFFRRHSPQALRENSPVRAARLAAWRLEERKRAVNYPLARWYLRPLATWAAEQLNASRVCPWHLTLLGLACAVAAASAIVAAAGSASVSAAVLVLLAWACDRTDGPLARLRGTASSFGAWLDANVDEAVDLGLHVCTAAVAAAACGSQAPWLWLIGFLVGKYLLMYGLNVPCDSLTDAAGNKRTHSIPSPSWIRSAWHFLANADVRIHLLAAAVASGLLVEELALIAVYYNVRWLLRYVLLARDVGRLSIVKGRL